MRSGLNIGVDIDDVLYKTQLMLYEQGCRLLDNKGISHKFDWNAYSLIDMFGIDSEIAYFVGNNVPWLSRQYVSTEAIEALKSIQHSYDANIHIITARDEKLTAESVDLFRNEFGLRIKSVSCNVSNKSFEAMKTDCNIMLDDYDKNILQFSPVSYCKPILVSPDWVKHNKKFALEFNNVLKDWKDLVTVINSTLGTTR